MHSVVIIFAAVIAVAAGQGIPTAHGVITGVADTPEVNAAKAYHFAAHAAARDQHVFPIAGIPTAYGVITGVADTPEVVAAKVQHFAAHAVARGHPIIAQPQVYAPHPQVYAAHPVVHHHVGHIAGIPTAHGVITGVADTPEVNAAKAQHFAAHADALARHG